jgi:hypothetical protein
VKIFDLIKIAAKLPSFAIKLYERIGPALEDGAISTDEAEAIAIEASESAGDLIKFKVKGIDIVDQEAEAHLAAFFGRLIRNLAATAGQ